MRTCNRRRPSGYSLLYSRRSRWVLDRYHQDGPNCSSFGSLSFTLSIISKCLKVPIIPQMGTHASATIPITIRAVIRVDINPRNCNRICLLWQMMPSTPDHPRHRTSRQGKFTFPVTAASSTGRCNTIQCIDPTMLARENQLFGCGRLKPSQGSVPASLTLTSDFGFCFQCQEGSSLVLRRPIEITALITHLAQRPARDTLSTLHHR